LYKKFCYFQLLIVQSVIFYGLHIKYNWSIVRINVVYTPVNGGITHQKRKYYKCIITQHDIA